VNIRIRQRDITDCGAACLASVAAWYNVRMPVSRIRQYAGTDKKGTNILGLIEAAEKLGFLAKGVKGEWESLFSIPKPAIAHVVVKEVLKHFVVIVRANEKYIEIMDPADGELHKKSHAEFKKEWTGVLVLIAPGETFKIRDEKESVMKKLWHLIKPSKHILLQSLAGAFAFSILGLASSLYLGKLVDHVIPGGNVNLLNLLGIAMSLIIIFRLLLSLFQYIFVLKTGQRIDASLILGYYQHLLKLPQSFFDNMRTGEIISRINDAVKIRVFINDVSINLVLNIFILIVSFILMFLFYWKLALIMMLVIPVYYSIYWIYNRLNKKIQRKVMERSADLEAQLVESLNAVSTIKRFSLEDYSNFKTETRFISLLESVYRSGLSTIFSSTSSAFVTQAITLALLWAGTAFVLKTEITPGELLSFYAIVGYFTGPVSSIIGFNRSLQDARIAADRLFEIFDLEVENDENKIDVDPNFAGDIVFDNVKFRYGTRVDVFDSLCMTIRKGEITAIAGESGSGKTTVVSLLQNIYPLNGGHIRIGKFDILHFRSKSLKKYISIVPQKVDLFAGNVIENIAVGEIEPDMVKVLEVCEKLGMISFIESLPSGFRTYLGENGANLSGGQKQRIAIARALYRDPDVLILDEATSSLDTVAETFVQNTIRLMREQKKTVIVIAHRLATISLADKIIVIDKGNVVQEGSFSELCNKEGQFRNMWTHQNLALNEMVNP
jgi:ATP-binding cassette subfamily B protein